MKNLKILTILTALMLLIAAPMIAQTPEDPMEQDELVETNAQFQADDDEGVEARAEVSIDDEPELNDNELEQETDVDVEANAELETNDDFENDDELPQTASPLALLALLGSAGAGTALGLRRLRK